MPASTLTSKGRITIPKEIRDRLHLRAGQRVEFQFDPRGHAVLKPRTRDIMSLEGIVRSRNRRPVSIDEMNEAITRAPRFAPL